MKRLSCDYLQKFTNIFSTTRGKKDYFFSPLSRQTIVALAPFLLTICSGMTSGYSAILLPQLQMLKNSTLSIDEEEASWIASMAALPMAVGSVLGGVLIEKIGRKSTHSLSCLPTLIGWLLIYLGTDKGMILAGRFITGLCVGVLGSATGVYIGETSEPAFRGFLLAGISCCIALGLFLSHLLGTFFSWRTTALVCASLPLASQIIIHFVPESPYWLAKKGQRKQAEDSFHWCRGYSEQAKTELLAILQKQQDENDDETFAQKIQGILIPEFLKPLAIIVVYIVANQWCGINAITFYTVSIMRETIGDGVNEYLAMLLVDTIRVFASLLACVLLRRIGRRPLALISGSGTALALLALSLHTHLAKTYPQLDLSSTPYIPMVSLVGYIAFISIGFVPLPWAMIGEVFPLRNRSVGSGISSFMAFTAFFSVVKTSPGMFRNFGAGGTFLTYGSVAASATVFVYFLLPETKGRTLHEIEDDFKRQSNKQGCS